MIKKCHVQYDCKPHMIIIQLKTGLEDFFVGGETCVWYLYGTRLFYVEFMYIENKVLVVRLLHKFNALV